MKKFIGRLGLFSMGVGFMYLLAAQDYGFTWLALGVAFAGFITLIAMIGLAFFFLWLAID